MSELHDLIGKTFERLTVIKRDGSNKSRGLSGCVRVPAGIQLGYVLTPW